MGIALYKRPRDGAVFAIVAPKTGAASDYLWQYRLQANRRGPSFCGTRATLRAVQPKGTEPDETGEIEAVVVDDALGYVYYSDEQHGIRKYHADPDHLRRLASWR